jgi:hypothetical protein
LVDPNSLDNVPLVLLMMAEVLVRGRAHSEVPNCQNESAILALELKNGGSKFQNNFIKLISYQYILKIVL